MTLSITEPGLYFDVSCDDYFADPTPEPSLSNSGIGVLLSQSPSHFAARHPRLNGGVDSCKASAIMHRGSVVHRLALGAGKEYAVLDFEDFRTKEAKAQRAEAEAAGVVPILAAKFAEAEEQAKPLKEALELVFMGEPWLPEVVIAWKIETKHGEIWCRAMVDAWCPSLMMAVDLKSTTDASSEAAAKKIERDGIDTQAAWYSRGLGHLIGKPGKVRFTILMSETEAPHATQPFQLDEAWVSSACEEAADLFAKCLKAKNWPGYPKNPQLLSPPDWLIRNRMFRNFGKFEEAA
jgi:hypothetical protein